MGDCTAADADRIFAGVAAGNARRIYNVTNNSAAQAGMRQAL